MAVDKEAISLSRVYSYYSNFKLPVSEAVKVKRIWERDIVK